MFRKICLKSVPFFLEEFHRARKPASLHRLLVHDQSSDDKQHPYAKSQACAVLRRRVPPCAPNQHCSNVLPSTRTRSIVRTIGDGSVIEYIAFEPEDTGFDPNQKCINQYLIRSLSDAGNPTQVEEAPTVKWLISIDTQVMALEPAIMAFVFVDGRLIAQLHGDVDSHEANFAAGPF
ncbi:hypothetical protein EVAR_2565_1 [Eumeta japonica]|uniref:Uncharacterized protein n=1 Tax=Eumeta variegata TaxID=151549 RepID=A0A4C1SPH1_EUMVA|nr:hypothetical protein EVAR_2565_1 [Eumeta japonica]